MSSRKQLGPDSESGQGAAITPRVQAEEIGAGGCGDSPAFVSPDTQAIRKKWALYFSPTCLQATWERDMRVLCDALDEARAEIDRMKGHPSTHICVEPELSQRLAKVRRDLDAKDHECARLRSEVLHSVSTESFDTVLKAVEQERELNATAAAQARAEEREAIMPTLAGLMRFGFAPGDWACAECRPNSDCILSGFQCHWHHAMDLLHDEARRIDERERK